MTIWPLAIASLAAFLDLKFGVKYICVSPDKGLIDWKESKIVAHIGLPFWVLSREVVSVTVLAVSWLERTVEKLPVYCLVVSNMPTKVDSEHMGFMAVVGIIDDYLSDGWFR